MLYVTGCYTGAVGLGGVTKKYLHREEVKEYIAYHDMKMAKIDMEPLEKCSVIRNRDCRYVQSYMYEKSLDQSRLESCGKLECWTLGLV